MKDELVRYYLPLMSLWDNWLVKALASAAVAVFHADVKFVVLLVGLLFLDFATGVVAALRRGERFTSRGIRQSFVKVVEYAVVLFVFVGLAHTYPILSWVEDAAFMWISLTEAKSIMENLLRPESDAYKIYLRLSAGITEIATHRTRPPAHTISEAEERIERDDEADESNF